MIASFSTVSFETPTRVDPCADLIFADSGHSDQEDTDDIEEEDRKNECKYIDSKCVRYYSLNIPSHYYI